MKVALCQMNIIWENKEKNLEKIDRFCKEAKESGAEVVFFPEMTCTGFTMNTDYSAESEKNLFTVNKVKSIAIETGIMVGIGWVKRNENCKKCENHYSIIGKNGEMISDYTKIHPFSFSNENDYFEGGKEIVHYNLGNEGIPWSTFICYDLRFPEIFRLVSKNVHAIVIPANWPQKRRLHWMTLLSARAIENQLYVLGINCVGTIGDLYYAGDSRVISPDGEVVASAELGREEIITYDLSDNVCEYRKKFPVLQDIVGEIVVDIQ